MANGVKVIVWREVLVVSDDGRSSVSDYDELFAISQELHASHPSGWGLLSIIPPNAVPPPDNVRAAINEVLHRVQHTVRAAVWCVEGQGFQGAMARAVLTGLRFLTSAPYARHVCTSIDEGFTWLLPRLEGGEERSKEVAAAVAHVRARRDLFRELGSARPR